MKTQNGFTLIELLITLTLAFVLMVVAVPSFANFMRNSQFFTQANDLFSELTWVRSEAIKRNSTVSICASNNGITCSGSSNWSRGWIVFTDTSGEVGVRDANDELLRVQDPLFGGMILTASKAGAISFDSSGYTTEHRAILAATTSFSLSHPQCSGDQQRVTTVTPYGRIQVTREACQ